MSGSPSAPSGPTRTLRAVRPHRHSPCALPARCVPTAVNCRCDIGRSGSTAAFYDSISFNDLWARVQPG